MVSSLGHNLEQLEHALLLRTDSFLMRAKLEDRSAFGFNKHGRAGEAKLESGFDLGEKRIMILFRLF